MNNYLMDEYPLLVLPKLAVSIGLNEAIILQQIHYWLQKSQQHINENKWVYNTVEQWTEQFPFWSTDTVRRGLANLKSKGLLIGETLSSDRRDRTMYYRIDYTALERIMQDSKLPSWDNGKLQPPKIANCNDDTSTETTTETTTDNNNHAKQKKHSPRVNLLEDIAPQIAADFLAIRKAKNLPLTKTALNAIQREAAKLGYSLEQALTVCCEHSWGGFQAAWVLKEQLAGKSPNSLQQENKESTLRAKARLFGSSTEKDVTNETTRL